MGTTMHKNFVVHENEYMQVDTLFSSSTNHVKQRTKEVEAISIGKGLDGEDVRMGTIRKNSLVLEKAYKQVDTTFSPSTNQVTQLSKEVETSKFFLQVYCDFDGFQKCRNSNFISNLIFLLGIIYKKIFFGSQRSYSRVFKNSVGSNQGMRSMDNNPLILGKENMRTNISLPPSPDKVMKPSQTVEIEDKFENDDMNDHCDHIFGWMNQLWNKRRGHLHSKYVKNKSMVHALKCKPERVEKKDWEWLVKEHFYSEIFRSKRNTTNRADLTMLHHIGSKPIREIMY
ncbi:hypothetical protein P3S68_032311 [Capsicum galapagoense]